MSTYDNDHRHPDWAPDVRDCPFESCAVCGPALSIPSNIVLGSE